MGEQSLERANAIFTCAGEPAVDTSFERVGTLTSWNRMLKRDRRYRTKRRRESFRPRARRALLKASYTRQRPLRTRPNFFAFFGEAPLQRYIYIYTWSREGRFCAGLRDLSHRAAVVPRTPSVYPHSSCGRRDTRIYSLDSIERVASNTRVVPRSISSIFWRRSAGDDEFGRGAPARRAPRAVANLGAAGKRLSERRRLARDAEQAVALVRQGSVRRLRITLELCEFPGYIYIYLDLGTPISKRVATHSRERASRGAFRRQHSLSLSRDRTLLESLVHSVSTLH